MSPSAGRGAKHCPLLQGPARVSLSHHWASPCICPSLPRKMSPFVSALASLPRTQAKSWIWISLVLSSPCTSTTMRPGMLAVSYTSPSSSWAPHANQLTQLAVWGTGSTAGHSRQSPAC